MQKKPTGKIKLAITQGCVKPKYFIGYIGEISMLEEI